MSLVMYELKKLFLFPALWAFVACCLVLNILFLAGQWYDRAAFNEISGSVSMLGQRIDGAFLSGLAALPETDSRDALLKAAGELKDEFDSYDVGRLSAYYQEMVKESPIVSAWMKRKYEKVSERVKTLGASDKGMDAYAGPLTYQSHQFLFGTLLRAVTAESCILSALSALYIYGYEQTNRTLPYLASSRTGRRLWRVKAVSGVTAAVLIFCLLSAVSLCPYFLFWDYGGIWNANVSSLFNYLSAQLVVRPFITWTDFSVAGYLTASLAMGAALTAVCSAAASVSGILSRNAYIAALTLTLCGAGGAALTSFLGERKWWVAYEASCFHPVILWFDEGAWFTESGLNAIAPFQECLGVCLNLALCGLGILFAARRFGRKDLM